MTEERSTNRIEELKDLHLLCQRGMLYEVEAWIRNGRPLQIASGVQTRGHYRSALEIALDTGQHSLCRLLLRNGYRLDLERQSPLDIALCTRRWDLLDLLLEHGADPDSADLETLFDTYRSELFERFQAAGVDLTKRHELAMALAHHTRNTPLFGFVRRHKDRNPAFQREVDMALGFHVRQGNERGIQLCLWAGADPHARVPALEWGSHDDPEEECSNAVDEAVYRGNLPALKRFKPDAKREDFDSLYASARKREVIDYLASIQPPHDIASIVRCLCRCAGSPWHFYEDWKNGLLAVLEHGKPWERAETKALAEIRRNLLGAKDWELKEVLRALERPEFCSPEIFRELTRTGSMRKRMLAIGLVKPFVKPISKTQRRGVVVKRLLRRYDRRKLYDEVWARPVIEVAESYRVSGVYLARICRTLQVPVPQRGYWAKLRSGKAVRRSPLRPLPKELLGREDPSGI